jgi:hypothetical protein
MKYTSWTFRPTDEVQSLISKAISKYFGKACKSGRLRSKLINGALEKHFADLAGKREEPRTKKSKAINKAVAAAVVILLGLCVIRSEIRTPNDSPSSFASAARAWGQTN